MQPADIVSVMAAVLYRERSRKGNASPEQARAVPVADAWRLWHLALEQWTDASSRDPHDPNLPA